MFASLCILGRLPALSLAELESLYGGENVVPVSNFAALLNADPASVSFNFLGGTIKFCKVLTELDTTNWKAISKFLIKAVPEHATALPPGKMRIGLSVYGLDVAPSQVTGTGLELKKVLRRHGRPIRVVPNKELELNSAQVLHNKLTGELGWELIFVKNGSKTIVAQSIAVQDIEAYAKRDHGRPKRDAKVGMLPPKLAQTIVNLATGESLAPGCGPQHPLNKVILDPFCGTGVVLQEASLMGYGVQGTDLEPRMVQYSKTNLDWLGIDSSRVKLENGDATEYKWEPMADYMASETYLGRPFTSPPQEEILQQTVHEVNTITKKFLQNLSHQTKPGFRLCIAVPAWYVGGKTRHLPVLDQLTDMGYTRVSFVHASEEELIYHREGQIVGRELVTLIRK